MTLMCGERWLETGSPFEGNNMNNEQYIANLEAENLRLVRKAQQLLSDCHRIDSARQAAVSQCAIMAEENQRLIDENNALKAALSEVQDD